MRSHEMAEQVDSRAVPLPEEAAAEQGGEDRHAEAAGILEDSEKRLESAAEAEAPADAADEHRRSADTADN